MKVRVSVLIVALLVFAGTASAATITFQASLAGATENPPVATPGNGLAVLTYDDLLHTLTVQVNFADLIGTTTDSHIHCCTNPPNNVGVAVGFSSTGFPLGVSSGTYSNVFNLLDVSIYTVAFRTNFGGGTAAGSEAALIAGMLAGQAYVNVHTNFRPGGEIRGFTEVVPEPATLSLLGFGAAFLAARARRRPAKSR